VVLSQIIGSLIIYVIYIWDSSTVTAQASRNVVIIDGHSLDPRVIMENSKIRFNLKNSDPSPEDSNKLSFNVFDKTNDSGDLSEPS
jgi:hypothetical protein